MIQFELDNAHDMHYHWLRDRRFGKRADFTGRTLENLSSKYKNFSHAIFDGAVIRNTNFTEANLTGLSATGTHFDEVDFTGADLKDSHFQRALFTNTTMAYRTTDLWNVVGNGTQIITLQLGGKHVVYTDKVLQIGCKQYQLPEVWDHSDDQLRGRLESYSEEEFIKLLEWWDDWKTTLQQLIHKNPADLSGIRTIYVGKNTVGY